MRVLALAVALGISACNPLGTKVAPRSDRLVVSNVEVSSLPGFGEPGADENAAPGAVFVVVEYDLKNVSDEAVSLGDVASAGLADPEGRLHLPDEIRSQAFQGERSNTRFRSAVINPAVTLGAAEVFEIPAAAWSDGNGWKVSIAGSDWRPL